MYKKLIAISISAFVGSISGDSARADCVGDQWLPFAPPLHSEHCLSVSCCAAGLEPCPAIACTNASWCAQTADVHYSDPFCTTPYCGEELVMPGLAYTVAQNYTTEVSGGPTSDGSIVSNSGQTVVPVIDEQTRREINDIKQKLDRIQRGNRPETPNINKLDDRIRQLQEMIKTLKSEESTSASPQRRRAYAIATTLLLECKRQVTNAVDIANVRTWVDSTGKFSRRGRFVAEKNGEVLIRKSDGKDCRVPMSKLSRIDQEYVTRRTGILLTAKAAPQTRN